MTRARLVLAILLSVGLIGGSLLHRILGVQSPTANLYVAPNANSFAQYERPEIPLVSGTSTKERLSETDLIGRQLVSDFIGLSTRGQATEENINALAVKHVEVIENLTNSKKIFSSDLYLVANNQTNLENYAREITEIYKPYQQNIAAAYIAHRNVRTVGPELFSLAKRASPIYLSAAIKLERMAVPYALAEEHTDLVNLLYANASAMEAMSSLDKDPAVAFAGVITLNGNLDEEESILASITTILNRNGI